MKTCQQWARRAAVVCLASGLSFVLALSSTATAASLSTPDLAGRWRMTITGFTGCGATAMLFDVTLDAAGNGTDGTLTTHGSCGDSVVEGLSFGVGSLTQSRSGTANLSCGQGCGWNLLIQLSRDRQTFNLVDVDPVNPGNYIAGVAIRQAPTRNEGR